MELKRWSQQNYCFSLIRKEKKLITLILKYLTQRPIKPFGEKLNLFFLTKVNLQIKFLLVKKGNALSDPEILLDGEKVISDDTEIAETFNKLFCEHSSQSKNFAKRNLRNRYQD